MANSKLLALSSSIGDYLKAIYLLSLEGQVSTNALASQLGISSPSVSGMLSKLQEQGLIDYERYKSVKLTPKGEREALRLLRRHRLIETFMIEYLNYSWDEVHEEAEALEHSISDRFTESLAKLLRYPTHDPHGDPIPNADGGLPDTPNTPLTELEPEQTLLVSRLVTQDDAVLRYLANLGIQPGSSLKLTLLEPVGGLLHIMLDGNHQVISKEMASLIRGEVQT